MQIPDQNQPLSCNNGHASPQHVQSTGLRVPIVAITANAYEEDKQRCLIVGMDDFIAKPFNSDDLYTVIGNILS